MSLVNASLRPSGASYRDRLIAKELNINPSKQIDDLLANNNGFLVFQEDVIAFLQRICGLDGSEADNIRRAIGRKDKERLEKALPQILDGYCAKSDQPREIAEEEA
jgi:DNA polymerase-3 subunit alpha